MLIAGIVLAVAAVLLFARLGHYALWDDEAVTALAAEGVWRTGDTTAVIGHNVAAWGGGILLRDLHDRWTPPLPAWLAAPFVGLMGNTALAARLPFAICGLLCVGLIVWWLWTERAEPTTWGLVAMGILGNVSLFLFFRQSRYYGVALLASVAMAFLYLRWDGRRGQLVGMALASICLMASNYMNYAALACCLFADYVCWGRKRRPFKPGDMAVLLLPQVVAGFFLLSVWNPFATSSGGSAYQTDWLQRAAGFWRNWRELNTCEFGIAALVIVAPLLGWLRREPWLWRLPVWLTVYVVVMSLVAPNVGQGELAEVRHLTPTIPAWIALAVLTIRALTRQFPRLAWPLACLAFGTNLLHAGWLAPVGPIHHGVHSAVVRYARELISPPTDPYTVAANWINAHVATGRSIWVLPIHMTYPLMYHAPKAVYAWQFAQAGDAQLKSLPEIHFFGRGAPDYLLAFGPSVAAVRQRRWWGTPPADYELVQTLNHFWHDVHRPELVARVFEPLPPPTRADAAIYVFQRVAPASGPTR